MNWLQANTMSIHELIRHLNHGQRQGDGTTMLVGRHAVTEAIRLLNLLGETNDALAACQSQVGGTIFHLRGLLRNVREDIEAAYNGLDHLTRLSVAERADPNRAMGLAYDAAEIKGRLLQHMKHIDRVLTAATAETNP